MASQPEVDLKQAKITVRSSDAREEILRELYLEPEQRPHELQDIICPRTGDSGANIHASLAKLRELGLVHRDSAEGRAVLYSLTEFGREVAEELDLTQPVAGPYTNHTTREQAQPSAEEEPVDMGAAQGFDNPGDQRAFEAFDPAQTGGAPDAHAVPEEVDQQAGQESPDTVDVDTDQVEQAQQQLAEILQKTNISIYELDVAIQQLKEDLH